MVFTYLFESVDLCRLPIWDIYSYHFFRYFFSPVFFISSFWNSDDMLDILQLFHSSLSSIHLFSSLFSLCCGKIAYELFLVSSVIQIHNSKMREHLQLSFYKLDNGFLLVHLTATIYQVQSKVLDI